MKRILLVLGLLVALVAVVSVSSAFTNDGVCPAGDSGKIDTSGDPQSVTVTAPAGQLISGYCVKGGDEGPIFVTVDPPASSVTIEYPGVNGGGQQPAVSHYSLSYTTITTTVPPTTVPPTTSTTTTSVPDDPPPTTVPTGSIDVDKTVHGDPDCEDDEPCFVIEIDCEDLDFTQVYDRTGHLIDGDSTYHDIPPGTVCIVTETETGGADLVTYDPAHANTTGVVITPEDPDNGRDQRVHVMVTNDFDPPPTTTVPVSSTVVTTIPTTTVPPPVCTVPDDCKPPCEPPGYDDCEPPPTTVPPPPPPTTDPPNVVPTCEDDPTQEGCSELPRTGSNLNGWALAGGLALAAGSVVMALRKRLT